MRNGRINGRILASRGVGLAVMALAATLPAMSAGAAPYLLAPDTKVTVTIVQWNPIKSEFQRWDAIGGTFVVSQDGTLSLPIIGTVDVAALSGTDLAATIATSLMDKVGLLSAPEVTVEVAAYPPVYVTGLVADPGEYEYRPGLTVLQALARSGGRYREAAAQGGDVVSLFGELAIVRADYLRKLGEVARLEAEQAGKDAIAFPTELTDDSDRALVDEIVALEETVFDARKNEARRQLESIDEKRDLLDQEIDTLEARASAGDKSIDIVEKQLEGVSKLYERGVATLTRHSDLERALGTLRVDRLGVDTDIMKVRQGVSDNQRQELTLRDERETQVAVELRDARGVLNRLRSQRETLVRLIGAAGGVSDEAEADELAYTIVRNENGRVAELPAGESTPLLPGDVLKVTTESQGTDRAAAPARSLPKSSDNRPPDAAAPEGRS